MCRLQAVLLSAVLCLFLGCATDTPNSPAPVDSDVEGAFQPSALRQDLRAQGYFIGRQDVRRCRWPLCGGYWVRLLNQATLRCLEGNVAEECYVALLDTEALGGVPLPGFGAGTVIARGGFAQGDAGEFGAYALLRVTAAWQAVSDAAPTGGFFRIEDNGLRCVTTPCFSLSANKLNSSSVHPLSDLDLTGVKANDDQLEAAYFGLAEGGLVASGKRTPTRSSNGVSFVATQFYLPVHEAGLP